MLTADIKEYMASLEENDKSTIFTCFNKLSCPISVKKRWNKSTLPQKIDSIPVHNLSISKRIYKNTWKESKIEIIDTPCSNFSLQCWYLLVFICLFWFHYLLPRTMVLHLSWWDIMHMGVSEHVNHQTNF